jgi:hypothetical protein
MSGTKAFDKTKESITKQGAAAEMAQAKNKGLIGALDGLKSQIETVGLALTRPLLDPLERIIRKIADMVPILASVNPQLVKMGFGFLAAMSIMIPVIGTLGGVAMAIGFIGAPITMLVLAIATLAGLWVVNWGSVRETTSNAATSIITSIKNIGTTIHDHLGVILQVSTILVGAWAATVAKQAVVATYMWAVAHWNLIRAFAAGVAAQVGFLLFAVQYYTVIYGPVVAANIKAAASFIYLGAVGIAGALQQLGRFIIVAAISGVQAVYNLANAVLIASGQFIWFAAQSVTNAILALVRFGITGMLIAAMLLPQLIVSLAKAAWSFMIMAVQGVGAAIRAFATFIATSLIGVIASIPALIMSLGAAAKAFVVLGVQATIAAVKMVGAWVAAALPAIIAAVGSIVAAVGTLLLPILLIGAAIAMVATAWQQNWGDMQGIVGKAINWISDLLSRFVNWMRNTFMSIPGMSQFLDWVGGGIEALGDTVGPVLDTGRKLGQDFITEFTSGFPNARKKISEMLGLDIGALVFPEGDKIPTIEEILAKIKN